MTATNLRIVAGQTIAAIQDCRECGLAEHDVEIVEVAASAPTRRFTFTCPQEPRPVDILGVF